MSDRGGCCRKQTCVKHVRDWLLYHNPANDPQRSSDEVKAGVKAHVTAKILWALIEKGYFSNFRKAFSYATDSVRTDAQRGVAVFPTTFVDDWDDFLWWLNHSSPAPTFLIPACLKAIDLFYASPFTSDEAMLIVGNTIVRRVFKTSNAFLKLIGYLNPLQKTMLVHGRGRRDDPIAEFVLTYG